MRTENPLRIRIVEALSRGSIDYAEQEVFLQGERTRGGSWTGAGVLLVLQFLPETTEKEGALVLLNKRSEKVRQAGDLCLPGGSPSTALDALLKRLLVRGLLPLSRGKAFRTARWIRDKEAFQALSYYLTVAIREAWEEIRLNPFSLDFLGPLPCYRLELFHRILFPLVTEIRAPFRLKANWEVDRILKVPLSAFFRSENYATYSIQVEGELRERIGKDLWEFPCLILNDHGRKEILWGATYNVLLSFLKMVFGFAPPTVPEDPKVLGELHSDYLFGRRGG